MSKPPTIDRKTLKTPDAFVREGTHWIAGIAKYRSKIVPLLVAGVVFVIANYAYKWWESKNLDKSWRTYHEATKATETAKWEALKGVVEKFPKNRATFFAAVDLGDHYFDESKKALLKDPAIVPLTLDDANRWYSKGLEFTGLLQSERQLLLINRASSYEMQKKYDEAEKDLKTASELGQELKGLVLLNSARIFELKSENAKAIETYEKVAADFLNTEYSKTAKNHARRLKNPNGKSK